MTDSESNLVTRRYLLLATSGVAAVGAAAAAVPFVRSWTPSAKARALGAPVRVDISKLEPGELLGPVPAWRGQPIFVVYRTESTLNNLEEDTSKLADPQSKKSTQPDYARNQYRSRDERPEIGVYLGLCTHLGCSPQHYDESRARKLVANWSGGFFCPCHGSRFDMAGRVEKNFPAPTNLVVPPFRFETEDVIVIGEDTEVA